MSAHVRGDATVPVDSTDRDVSPSQSGVGTFDEIYEACGDRVLSLCFRMTSDEDTARDLSQEIFVKIYEKLDTFEGRAAVTTWVYRIAINHIKSYLKSQRRRRWLRLDTADDSVQEIELTSSEPGPDRVLETVERQEAVQRAVSELPEKYGIPITLFYFEKMSYREIAEVMELSLSAVEARIHRAKKQLARALEPRGKNI